MMPAIQVRQPISSRGPAAGRTPARAARRRLPAGQRTATASSATRPPAGRGSCSAGAAPAPPPSARRRGRRAVARRTVILIIGQCLDGQRLGRRERSAGDLLSAVNTTVSKPAGAWRVVGPQPQRRLVEVLERDADRRFALEGQPPGQHLVQHNPGGVDVGGWAASFLDLLRRRVVDGAHRHASRGQIDVVQSLGDAEVGHLDQAVRRDQDILRLDVAMDQSALVGVTSAAQIC